MSIKKKVLIKNKLPTSGHRSKVHWFLEKPKPSRRFQARPAQQGLSAGSAWEESGGFGGRAFVAFRVQQGDGVGRRDLAGIESSDIGFIFPRVEGKKTT